MLTVGKTEASYIFSKFIIDNLDEFERVEKLYDITEEELNRIDNTKREEMRIKAIKLDESMKGMPREYYYLKKGSSSFVDDISEFDDIENNKQQIQKELNDRKESLMDEGMKALGPDATTDDLDEFVNDYEANAAAEKDIIEEQFNLIQPKEGLDVLDTGFGYGDTPQGIEDAGDGLDDNYFADNDLSFSPLVN